jgi:hypothetical protein
MGDPKDALASMKAAADQIVAADDNLLRAIAAIAAHGRITIVPCPDHLLVGRAKPIITLPQRMYDRLLAIIPEDRANG